MTDLRRSSNNGLGRALWISKIGFLILGILSAGVLGRLAIPSAAGELASFLPRVWAFFSSWLAPPYLFVFIHLIILVIWKLSDHRQQHLDPWSVEERPSGTVDALKIKTLEPLTVEPLPPEPLVEHRRDILPSPTPLIEDSRASQPSDPRKIEAPAEPAASSSFEIKTSAEAPTEIGEDAQEEADIAAALEGIENESLEETWRAIMAKSPRGEAKPAKREAKPAKREAKPAKREAKPAKREARPPPPVAVKARPPAPVAVKARLPSVTGREELNERFDNFIKKGHEQIRLQRLESNQRRLEVANAESY